MVLVYLIIALSAVPNHPWFGESVGGVTLIKLVGVLALGYALVYLPQRRTSVPLLKEWPARLLFVLVAWASISAIAFGMGPVTEQSALKIYISLTMIFVVSVMVIDSRLRLERAVLALLGAMALASLYTLREYQVAGFSAYRPGWVAGDANYFSANALIALPVAYHLLAVPQKRWQRWFCLGSLLLTFLAFVVAGSRGGFAGFCVVCTVLFLRSKSRFRLMAVGLLAIPLLLLAPMSPIKRIMSPETGDVQSQNIHQTLWKFGVQQAIEHPVFGIGLGNFKPMVEKNQVLEVGAFMAHNAYIEIAAELGIFALLVFLGIFGTSIAALQRVRRRAMVAEDAYLKMVTTGLQEGLIGFAVAAFFISAQYQKPFWIVVSLAALLPSLAVTMRATQDKPAGSLAVTGPMAAGAPIDEAPVARDWNRW